MAAFEEPWAAQARADMIAVQQRRADWAQHEREALERRMAAERAEGERIAAERRRREEAQLAARAAWVKERDRLQAELDDLRRQLGAARSTVLTGSIDEARIAASDVQVYQARLVAAERAVALHRSQQV